MELKGLLEQFERRFGTQRNKGTAFEDLILHYMKLDPVYANDIDDIWMWKDFPHRGAIGDTGIDLVAKTYAGDFWAIQCKFYSKDTQIAKGDVDSFLSTSSKTFSVDGVKTKFSHRYFVTTTDNFSKNAADSLKDQDPAVSVIGMEELLNSPINWDQFAKTDTLVLNDKYSPRPHQRAAIDDVIKGFKTYDRGKLIMACGTGKTFTSLRLAEEYLDGKGNILFLVPSIALVNQTLTEWAAQSNYSFRALVVCSDTKASKNEDSTEMIDDLIIPSTTDIHALKRWVDLNSFETSLVPENKRMNYVFSTYQSIEKVAEMQRETGFHFDLIICDEAHRTTGAKLANSDESYFMKVHSNDFIKADKRLYMTATPRVYGNSVKDKAKENDAVLCSMDDESLYGPEFHCLTFGQAVQQGLLTDYKVLILAIDEEYVKRELQGLLTDGNHEISLDDATKIMGCWKGLSKVSIDENDISFKADPSPMKRVVAFTNRIKDSKALVNMFQDVQNYMNDHHSLTAEQLQKVEIQHVDGTMNAVEKKKEINWLKENTDDNVCRILTNARCLSEGVDVPALDAVMFLNPRSSVVDIIQSVGRVMRRAQGKLYGYIVLPIGISATEEADKALDNNDKYKIVWDVLQALRSHDDRFDNTINKINLNKTRPDQIKVIGIGSDKRGEQDSDTGAKKAKKEVEQMTLDLQSLEDWQNSIYAKMVKKVGSRLYWERWAKNVGEIAQRYIERIRLLLDQHDKKIDSAMLDFVAGLQNNLNSSITQDDAIEMLAQHMITKPIFDALFGDYEFVQSNPVSKSMERMLTILDNHSMEAEKEGLEKFYESVKKYVGGIDNNEGKQRIIIELYDKFFKVALPKEVEKLGIVYTPVECVDFIINSVEKLLNNEFGKSLSDKGVHIIDGFTGTGTFIVRLIQSGIIKKDALLYKYTNEIHANEIVLLAYYIAAINIEEAFHEISDSKQYIPFEGIVLTDTFQLYEGWKDDEWTQAINEEVLPRNSKRAKKQRELPITVAISNPPYSVGQKSQNDNAQNLSYPNLDKRIASTYALHSSANLKKNLYNSYIRAFRWASDRLNDQGIIAYITANGWLEGNDMDGFRYAIQHEFDKAYIFNLKGAIRGRKGDDAKKQGQNIFNIITGVAITLLVKNHNAKDHNCEIYYSEIEDYKNRAEKLHILKNTNNYENLEFIKIIPNAENDWINKRSKSYGKLIPLSASEANTGEIGVFINKSPGIASGRDAWVYNFSKKKLSETINAMIDEYNNQLHMYQRTLSDNPNTRFETIMNLNPCEICWTDNLKKYIHRGLEIPHVRDFRKVIYRPFQKEFVAFSGEVLERKSRQRDYFPDDSQTNLLITLPGKGGVKAFYSLMVDTIRDYDTFGGTQCYPLYTYEELKVFSLLDDEKYIRKSNINPKFVRFLSSKLSLEKVNDIDVFYWIYAVLNSKKYQIEFESDLKKTAPRVPLPKTSSVFYDLVKYGKELAQLHIEYENQPRLPGITVVESTSLTNNQESYYKVTKMSFPKKNKETDKSTIIFNENIIIKSIPIDAYNFIVNGKSAIEWVMERYQLSIDKKSGIVNDPNDWCDEVNDKKYILNLLLSIITISVRSIEIIKKIDESLEL